jgi:hypothetical protein
MRTSVFTLLLCFVAGISLAQVAPVINEFVFNHAGTDDYEFVEIFASPNTDLSRYTILGIEGDNTGAGLIDNVFNVGSTDAAGFWTTGFLSNVLENGTLSLLLVVGFSGAAGQDLDTDNDGVLDATPWNSLADTVAVWDGGLSDWTYANVVLDPSFDGLGLTVGGASRIPNGIDTDTVSDWVRNDYEGAGLPGFLVQADLGEAINTPGAVNAVAIPEPATLVLALLGGLAFLRRKRS